MNYEFSIGQRKKSPIITKNTYKKVLLTKKCQIVLTAGQFQKKVALKDWHQMAAWKTDKNWCCNNLLKSLCFQSNQNIFAKKVGSPETTLDQRRQTFCKTEAHTSVPALVRLGIYSQSLILPMWKRIPFIHACIVLVCFIFIHFRTALQLFENHSLKDKFFLRDKSIKQLTITHTNERLVNVFNKKGCQCFSPFLSYPGLVN